MKDERIQKVNSDIVQFVKEFNMWIISNNIGQIKAWKNKGGERN